MSKEKALQERAVGVDMLDLMLVGAVDKYGRGVGSSLDCVLSLETGQTTPTETTPSADPSCIIQ